MSRVIAPAHLHDLGKLMLAFVMLWAYFSFSQFLIIWSANLPEEIPWYLQALGRRLAVGRPRRSSSVTSCCPSCCCSRATSSGTDARWSAWRSPWSLMRLVDLFWQIGPMHGADHFGLHWMDLAVPVALGGIWVAIFLWQLQSRALLPLGEPYLAEALEHGRHGH